jgi:hypothetical protein
MQRQRAIVGLGAAVGLAWVWVAWTAAFLWLGPGRPEVSVNNLAWLTPGMSKAAVAAVLGPPAADLTDRLPAARFPPPAAGNRVLEYAGERATAAVEFGPDGRLVRWYPIAIQVVSGLERIRLRLNWW